MLQRSLHELAIGAQLGGPLMADRLCHYLRSLQYSSAEVDSLQALKSKCVQAIQLDLDQRWPRNFRLNELERISGHVCGPTFLTGPELISVQAAFDELMMVDGELISFRPSHVQAYTRLASELEPSLLDPISVGGSSDRIERFQHLCRWASLPMTSIPSLRARTRSRVSIARG
jgi:hypothetical protein